MSLYRQSVVSIGAEELAEFGEQIHKSSRASKDHVGIWVWPLWREREREIKRESDSEKENHLIIGGDFLADFV